MKLALIGDLHLSETSPRYQHTLDVLDFVIDDAETQARGEALAFAFLGDLYEGHPSGTEYADLLERVHRMRGSRDVYAILGNHESYVALAFWRHLGIVTAWDNIRTHDLGLARLLLVPYPRRGRAPFELLGDDGTMAESRRAAAAVIAERVKMALQATTPLLVLGHWTVEGMTTRDADFELHTATEVVVPWAAFDGVALTAVGHIHRQQALGDEGDVPNILSVGGLVRHSFAEADDPKSYTLVTVDQGRVTWERRPVPAREMVVGTTRWLGEIGPNNALVLDFDFDPGAVAGKEVKLTVEIAEDRLSSFDPSVFDPLRAAAALFVLDRRTVSVQRQRAPEIGRAESVGAQLATWLRTVDREGVDDARQARLAEKVAEVER